MLWIKNLVTASRRHPVAVETVVKSTSGGPIRYRLTDPGSVQVIKEDAFPAPFSPFFQVAGFYGGGHELDTPAGQSAGVYMTIHNAIRHYNEFAEKPLAKWQATTNLRVMTRAGRNFNAYYNRNVLAFFLDFDPSIQKDIYTADSPDIVTHELGHAILDSIRPDLWGIANLEVWAFHESYGDIMSIVSALQHPEVAQVVLDVTGGDLRKNNPISCLAEQMSRAICASCQPPGMSPLWLRNAQNNFKYISPLVLPDNGPDDQLLAEPHNFSRILTGALYDCLICIYKNELSSGKTPLVALLNAGKGLGWYVSRAALRTPVKGKFFQSFATTMLAVDQELSGRFYYDRFKWIFQNRGIISLNPKLLLSNNTGTGEIIEVKLNDRLPIRSLSINPLYKVNLQIADDGLDSLLAAQDLVQYLHKFDKVSDNHNAPFHISDGRLERSYFSCCLRNWENPTQPEYLKPPKPENHFQPCGGWKSVNQENDSKLIIKETNTRHKNNI